MNRHLNLFKAFSQNLSHENIEDNLSRALVICLQNNNLLFHEFLKKIFAETGQIAIYNSIFTDITELDNLKMDLQVKTDDINTEEFRKVFAIAISGRALDMSGFYSNKANKNKSHITDIFITICICSGFVTVIFVVPAVVNRFRTNVVGLEATNGAGTTGIEVFIERHLFAA